MLKMARSAKRISPSGSERRETSWYHNAVTSQRGHRERRNILQTVTSTVQQPPLGPEEIPEPSQKGQTPPDFSKYFRLQADNPPGAVVSGESRRSCPALCSEGANFVLKRTGSGTILPLLECRGRRSGSLRAVRPALAVRGKSRKIGIDSENRMWYEGVRGLEGAQHNGDGQEEP